MQSTLLADGKTHVLGRTLRFTPYAWAKLLFMCHTRDTEVGGFGVSAVDNPLLIEDIIIPKQVCNAAYTEFDNADVAALTFAMVDPDGPHKISTHRFQRIWIHTHPEGVSSPSHTDEQTFSRSFGAHDWSIMFIYCKSGETYCRLRVRTLSVEVSNELDVTVAWNVDCPAINREAWHAELNSKVSEKTIPAPIVTQTLLRAPASARVPWVTPKTVPKTSSVPATVSRSPIPQSREGARTSQRPQKTRLVPLSGTILSGLNSTMLTTLLLSEPEPKDIRGCGAAKRLAAVGWCLDDEFKGSDAYGSTVFFRAERGTEHYGNIALGITATADYLKQAVRKTEINTAVYGRALTDLEIVTDGRQVGELNQVDSFGEPLSVVYPWVTQEGTVLLVSASELEELIDAADGKEPLEVDLFDKANDTVTEIVNDLRVLGVSENEAYAIARARLAEQGSIFDDGQPTLGPSAGPNIDNRVVEEFRKVLLCGQHEGKTSAEIDVDLAGLYDRMRGCGLLEDYMKALQFVRQNGYNPMCLV